MREDEKELGVNEGEEGKEERCVMKCNINTHAFPYSC